jgi:hypothetical protein
MTLILKIKLLCIAPSRTLRILSLFMTESIHRLKLKPSPDFLSTYFI